MSNYITSDSELQSVANAIREKGGTSAPLVYPTGFVSAIEDIQVGASYPEAAGNYFGTELITFTVDFSYVSPKSNLKSYNALAGMTWGDFIDSEYNDYFNIGSGLTILYGADCYISPYVYQNDLIVPNGTYALYPIGGGGGGGSSN